MDLGGRGLGYVLSFDHDLNIFAASLRSIKTFIEAVVKNGGMFLLAAVMSSRSNMGQFSTRCRFGSGRHTPLSRWSWTSALGEGTYPSIFPVLLTFRISHALDAGS